MQSKALTVLDYLNEHSPDRREVLVELLETFRANIQPGFDEARRWTRDGLKLDIGKACVRFKDLAGADLETIGWAAGLLSPAEYLEQYKLVRSGQK
jgi:hypothetical protein